MPKLRKVLIADDEPMIREGIRDAIPWHELGMIVIGEAEDGEDALDLALHHQIDIILVDLNMPIMNGLALVGHLRERLPKCSVVIITGHDEFSYAQEAIRLQVDEYILKPVNPKQLKDILTKVCRKLEEVEAKEEQVHQATKHIRRNLTMLRERFCLEWVEGNVTEEEVREQLQFLQLPSDVPAWLALLRWPEIHTGASIMKDSDRQLLLFAIENMADELLRSYEHVCFRIPMGMVVMMVWGEASEKLFTDIELAVQSYLKLSVFVHAERITNGMDSIPAVFAECKSSVYAQAPISPVARRAKYIIREQYSDPALSLESAADTLQVSSGYLSRLMKQELGVSFTQLLTQTRIYRAVQLLNSTDLPIHDISEQVGYETQHYFSSAFKKVMGVSPNQYRKGFAFHNISSK
ncbi:response regulator [Marinicrinis lubricantis]